MNKEKIANVVIEELIKEKIDSRIENILGNNDVINKILEKAVIDFIQSPEGHLKIIEIIKDDDYIGDIIEESDTIKEAMEKVIVNKLLGKKIN